MEAVDVLWILPYVVLVAVFYLIYAWKTARGRRLLAKARTVSSSGNVREAVRLLKEALWKANEKPGLERSILNDLAQEYRSRGISFDLQDYLILIEQFQDLSKKGSTKAMEELKQVQALKKQIIERMPNIP